MTSAVSQKGIRGKESKYITPCKKAPPRVQNYRWSSGALINCTKPIQEGTCFCSQVCVWQPLTWHLFSQTPEGFHNLRVVFCFLDHATEWDFFSFTFGGLIISLLISSFSLTFLSLNYLRHSDGPCCHLCKQIKISLVYIQFRVEHSTLDPSPKDQLLQEWSSLFSIYPFNCLIVIPSGPP